MKPRWNSEEFSQESQFYVCIKHPHTFCNRVTHEEVCPSRQCVNRGRIHLGDVGIQRVCLMMIHYVQRNDGHIMLVSPTRLRDKEENHPLYLLPSLFFPVLYVHSGCTIPMSSGTSETKHSGLEPTKPDGLLPTYRFLLINVFKKLASPTIHYSMLVERYAIEEKVSVV